MMVAPVNCGAKMLNKTHVGDCRDILALAQYQGVRAQTCVTSPPYFGLRDYGVAGQIGLEQTPDAYVNEIVDVFRAVRDVLADDGTLWLNLGDSYVANRGNTVDKPGHDNKAVHETLAIRTSKIPGKPKDLIGIPWRVAFALQSDGWWLRSDIIWHKPNPMPESVTDRPTKAHEYLFLFAKQPKYYYDADAIKERSVGAASGFGGSDKRNARTVWTITPKPFKGAHFATFPPELVRPCILAGSRPGDTVLDPFMGSGTVAQVAGETGRSYLGCELNEKYLELHALRGLC